MTRKLLALLLVVTLMLVVSSCQPKAGLENNTQNPETGELTIAFYDAPRYDRFVFEAAMLFEKTHPGTKINIKAFSEMPERKEMELEGDSSVVFSISEDDTQAVKDYISRTSAELMSGKGADIIAADVLPWYKYVENGSFLDLRAFMDSDSDFNPSDYRANVLESVRYKSGQFIMPIDFALQPIIIFDKTKFTLRDAQTLQSKKAFTYWELMDLIDKNFSSGESALRAVDITAPSLLGSLLNLDYNKYVDLENKKAFFTDGAFSQMLEKIDEQRKKGYFKPEFSSADEMAQDFTDSRDSYYYKWESHWVLPGVFFAENYGAAENARIPKPYEIAGLIKNDKGETPLKFTTAFGINANSKNIALAWEFMKFMLSVDGQLSFSLVGLPINNEAFEERAKMLSYESEAENSAAYKDYIACLNALTAELGGSLVTDKIINNMAASETAAFLEGKQSAKEAAAALQNKVMLYFNE